MKRIATIAAIAATALSFGAPLASAKSSWTVAPQTSALDRSSWG